MQIKFDEKEKEFIEKVRRGEDNLKPIFMSSNQEKISLELKINDPYKCDRFISELMYKLDDATKEELGFEVSAVSLLGVYSDLKDLKNDIYASIETTLANHGVF